jgi:hypothetical protein
MSPGLEPGIVVGGGPVPVNQNVPAAAIICQKAGLTSGGELVLLAKATQLEPL